ncbi:MAG: hypothetical protein AAF329_04685 [Cyanobacteria bacterium P01_A01_bin.17]
MRHLNHVIVSWFWVALVPQCTHPHRRLAALSHGRGITNDLIYSDSLDRAQFMAGHSDIRTPRLYDWRQEQVSYDEG